MQFPTQPQRQVKQARERRAAVPRRPRPEPIFQKRRVARADVVGRETKRKRIVGFSRLAPIDDIRSRFPTGVFQRLGDDKRETLRQQQAQKAAVELPQSILQPVRARQLPLPRHGILRLVVREESIDQQSID